MFVKRDFVWYLYLAIYLYFVVNKTYHFFAPDSSQNIYYHILAAFDKSFYPVIYFSYFQIILNILSIVPLFCFMFYIHFLAPTFWEILFIMKVIFDILGHTYEINGLVGFYHTSPKICFIVLSASVLPYVPSYIAFYLYAFKRDEHFRIRSLNQLQTSQ